MKRLIIAIVLFLSGMQVNLFSQGSIRNTEAVKSFGEGLTEWASHKDVSLAMETFDNVLLRKPGTPFANIILSDAYTQYLVNKYNQPKSSTYRWPTFVNCMEKEVSAGVRISQKNINIVPENMVTEKRPGVEYFTCHLEVSGDSNLSEDALFYVKDGKILKIDKYQVIVDKKGRRRVKVDFSGLSLDEEDEGWGATYNFSKSFPVGASVYYSRWKFMIGLDFGVNFDKDKYTTQKVEFNNLMDYKITRGEFDPKYFITATPAFYLKYFSVGWGFGVLSMSGKEEIDMRKVNFDENGEVSSISTSSKSEGLEKIKFMMRPNVRGFIPVNDNLFIAVSVSYNWVSGYKKKNGVDFGLGFHYLLD